MSNDDWNITIEDGQKDVSLLEGTKLKKTKNFFCKTMTNVFTDVWKDCRVFNIIKKRHLFYMQCDCFY